MIEDLQQVLTSESEFVYFFRGKYQGAHGRTIDSQTDRNLRHGIGEPNLCRFYQDLFTFVDECIEVFKRARGNKTFKDVTKAV